MNLKFTHLISIVAILLIVTNGLVGQSLVASSQDYQYAEYNLAQNTVLKRMPVTRVSIGEALDYLKQKFEVNFSYLEDLNSMGKIPMEILDENEITPILNKIFQGTSFRYKEVSAGFYVVYLEIQKGNEISINTDTPSPVDLPVRRSQQPLNKVEYLPTSHRLLQQIKETAFNITGQVVDQEGEPLIGVNILIKGSNNGTATDFDGRFTLDGIDENAVLVVSYIGYQTQEVPLTGKSSLSITLLSDSQLLDEIVVVGYGTQKKSDITGSVTSMSKERLDNIPAQNVAQIIQGTMPGVRIQTTSAGAAPSESLIIRGRNSIAASNGPLVIVDGIPGDLNDINPNDVQSIEILKDASSAAIYGSRGSNGVILITSKSGVAGETKLTYRSSFSSQKPINILDNLNGEEFYAFKKERAPDYMTLSEQAIYDAKEWVDWNDLIVRTGFSQDHNIALSGGGKNTRYYISGALTDVKGITINDHYLRATSRVNVETDFKSWLTVGTKSQFSYYDHSGASPSWGAAYNANPLTKAYDENGKITIYPWDGVPSKTNPLQALLWDDNNDSYRIVTNNFAILKIPYLKGLVYRINVGFNFGFGDRALYKGTDTADGLGVLGSAETSRRRDNSTVIENILSYKNDFEKHSIFLTALYSFEGNKNTTHALEATGFDNDILLYYAANQANFISPNYDISESHLISQMIRFNYSYDSRYLGTLTARRDGFSGFGKDAKWGVFPSFAFGWNIHNEAFYADNVFFSQLKLRISYGVNGNQAVGNYKSLTRLGENHYVDSKVTAPGYFPVSLGDANLGWESSKTFNFGLDFGIFNNRISGDIDVFKTNTTDLLLNRHISSIHGISSITTNIGEVLNQGIELSVNSRNVVGSSFSWATTANFTFTKNEVVSLYGLFDDNGEEIDDLANNWFIGKPISSNYDFDVIGVWQLDEIEEAKKWNVEPGNVKFDDVNGDYKLDSDDKKFLGQQDPTILWGLSNSFFYKNLGLNIFIHGVHGYTRHNSLMHDHVLEDVRHNTMKKNWWSAENPTNDFHANRLGADQMGGIESRQRIYENASFIRIKDISLSYDLSKMNLFGVFDNLKVYLTGKNYFTFTKWNGLDPELTSNTFPLQREVILGVNIGL